MKAPVHTERRTPYEKEDKDWSDASASQGMPRIASNHRKLEERHKADSPSDLPEGTNPADILISDF